MKDAGFRFCVESALVREIRRPRKCPRLARLTTNPNAFLRGNYDVVIEALATIEPARTLIARLLEAPKVQAAPEAPEAPETLELAKESTAIVLSPTLGRDLAPWRVGRVAVARQSGSFAWVSRGGARMRRRRSSFCGVTGWRRARATERDRRRWLQLQHAMRAEIERTIFVIVRTHRINCYAVRAI